MTVNFIAKIGLGDSREIMNEINVGLIGYGMASSVFHAPFITATPGLKLTRVFERRSSVSKDEYPSVEIVRDVDEVLRDGCVDLIVVATPNSTHFQLAQRALAAGKNVIVEKPFTTTSAQAKELIDLAREKNVLLSAHQNRRWDGDYLTVQKIVGAGVLGTLVEYEAHYDRFRDKPRGGWKESDEGTGVLYDLGSHLIDQAQVLFGLPEMITADIRTQRDFSKVVDNFELILHYDGLKVTLKSGLLVREPLPRYILHGTKGSFVKYGLDPQEEALNQGRKPTEPNWGIEPGSQWGRLNTEIDNLHFEGTIETEPGCYQAFYQNIAAALRGEAELAVKPEEAFNTIRIIELALQSNLEKRSVVFSAAD
jgi:scyllo-inositol 2-dehydrogenase (NADP+)